MDSIWDRSRSSDRALALASEIWGDGRDDPAWEYLDSSRRERVFSAWPTSADGEISTAIATSLLKAEHAAQRCFDIGAVHPSWFSRALRDESAAVRQAARKHSPRWLRTTLERESPARESATSSRADPEILKLTLTLWTERLIGDQPARADDSLAIAVTSRLGRAALYRYLATTGIAKLSQTGDAPPSYLKPREAARFESCRRRLESPARKLVGRLSRDLRLKEDEETLRLARVGMNSLARVLADDEPYRVRWAFQHLPYEAARVLRSAIESNRRHSKDAEVADWERSLLRTARDVLIEERRLPPDWRELD